MNIADRIQSLRKMRGISQEELADRIGVSRQAVSKWESEQSIPEIDKIIIMSDFFEVTTDYILKGIEIKEQVKEKEKQDVDANIFLLAGTFLIFIGLVLACAIWYEKQTIAALALGFVLMAMGCLNFGIGIVNSTKNVEKAKKLFWQINIWLLTFVPFSSTYNALFGGFPAPYPLFWGSVFPFQAFWMVYIAFNLSVVFVMVRKGR